MANGEAGSGPFWGKPEWRGEVGYYKMLATSLADLLASGAFAGMSFGLSGVFPEGHSRAKVLWFLLRPRCCQRQSVSDGVLLFCRVFAPTSRPQGDERRECARCTHFFKQGQRYVGLGDSTWLTPLPRLWLINPALLPYHEVVVTRCPRPGFFEIVIGTSSCRSFFSFCAPYCRVVPQRKTRKSVESHGSAGMTRRKRSGPAVFTSMRRMAWALLKWKL